ncbi:hypothetical protein [uncultured Agrobacterium sp.]|uniref:DUF7256 domain-containing protein n=1 Tax=uncultured Agrobacterium sp. TaxID=157277 RepID=UPI0025D69BAA|nr:hypothetical protein [uncultured Agrobacterium sp.]
MRKREFLTGAVTLGIVAGMGGEPLIAQDDSVDVSALAALRPGMPGAAVEKAMGTAWRAPAPHKGGVIDILENTYGVIVRLDRTGRIGTITFNSRFDQTIAGVPMGISLKELPSAVPDMKVGEESKVLRGTRYGTMRLPEGILSARISNGNLYEIEISNPKAEYTEPTAPPYPVAKGAPGAPFSDPNLKLVVMSSLLRSKLLDLGTPEQLASHVLGRQVDLEQDGYDLIPQALDYLVRYPLTPELLDAVDRVQIDGGEEIYPYAWYFWGGEETVFDVRDTSDIGLCVNLKAIFVTSMIDSFDLQTLVPLHKLEWIDINVPAENIKALLDIRSLKKVEGLSRDADNRDVVEKLKSNGVQIY